MRTVWWVFGGLVCILLSGCRTKLRPDTSEGFAPKRVSLKGTYGIQREGELEPVLKVDETKTGYAFEERSTGEWKLDPKTPHVVGEVEVEHALELTSVTGFPVFGLANGDVVLLKVPAGWRGAAGSGPGGSRFETRTGFILVTAGRLVEAKKVELGSR